MTVPTAPGLRLNHRQLAALLPIRRQRSLAERMALGRHQADVRAAEATCRQTQARIAPIAAARDKARLEERQRVREGTTGAALRTIHERIEWLQVDLRRATDELRRAEHALDLARQRVHESRLRLLNLDERVRQLEKLVNRARLLEERRVARRLETQHAERMAGERRRLAASRSD